MPPSSTSRAFLIAALTVVVACSTTVHRTEVPQSNAADVPQTLADTLRMLLGEARDAARHAPDAQRLGLLERIAQAQTRTHDFSGAEQTLALVATSTSEGDTLTAAQRIETNLLCTLLESRRSADAVQFVARVRSVEDQSWLQARLASRMATGHEARLFVSSTGDDTTGQLTRALDVAQRISLPEARVDALIAVSSASTKHPSIGARASRAALDALAGVRAPDKRQSRTAMLVPLLFRSGELELAKQRFAALTNLGDRSYVVVSLLWGAPAYADLPRSGEQDALLDAMVRRVVDDARDASDREVSRSILTSLRDVLVQTKHREWADRLIPERLVPDPPPASPVVPSALDRAREALGRHDFAAVQRFVSSQHSSQREARAWTTLAWETYMWNRDRAATFLARAHDALVREPMDSAAFDAIASKIAEYQSWIGDQEGAVATIDLVRSANATEYAVSQFGSSTFSTLNARSLRALASRVHRPAVRDQFFLRIIAGYLLVRGAAASDIAWAAALADSIGTPAVRNAAHELVASNTLARGDSASARTMYAALLPRGAPLAFRPGWSPLSGLVRAGGTSTLVAWARADAPPAVRAERLMEAAEILRSQRRIGSPMIISNGPDMCRDVL